MRTLRLYGTKALLFDLDTNRTPPTHPITRINHTFDLFIIPSLTTLDLDQITQTHPLHHFIFLHLTFKLDLALLITQDPLYPSTRTTTINEPLAPKTRPDIELLPIWVGPLINYMSSSRPREKLVQYLLKSILKEFPLVMILNLFVPINLELLDILLPIVRYLNIKSKT